jgi:hypothetical protein
MTEFHVREKQFTVHETTIAMLKDSKLKQASERCSCYVMKRFGYHDHSVLSIHDEHIQVMMYPMNRISMMMMVMPKRMMAVQDVLIDQ